MDSNTARGNLSSPILGSYLESPNKWDVPSLAALHHDGGDGLQDLHIHTRLATDCPEGDNPMDILLLVDLFIFWLVQIEKAKK